MSTMKPGSPDVKGTPGLFDAFDPAIAAFLSGIPEAAALVEALAEAEEDEWAPHDAWTWELGPEPDDEDRAWHAQHTEGGLAEGESDRSDINAWTLDGLEFRLDRMAEAVEEQDAYERGHDCW